MPPTWTGPSEFEAPKVFAIHATLAESTQVTVTLELARTFSNGAELDLQVTGLGPGRPRWLLAATPPWATPDGLRLEYTDIRGRSARLDTDVHLVDKDDEGLPRTPVLMLSLAARRLRSLWLRIWAWPLPSAGPAELAATWEEVGIARSTLLLPAFGMTIANNDIKVSPTAAS